MSTSNDSSAWRSPPAARVAKDSTSSVSCVSSTLVRPPSAGRWSGTIPTVSLPARLGRLRQLDRLGVGGFATVWLYHDPELRSDVAVKALADNWAQRLDIRDRFLEEARILRQADSDHVVRVYDIGETSGTPYFVMTYADRGSLAGLLEAGRPLPVEQVVDLVEQAAAG